MTANNIIIIGFAVISLTGLLFSVLKERNIAPREGAVMGSLLLASAGLQLVMGDRYSAHLNALSLLCMGAFWAVYSRNLSRRVNKRVLENRLKRKP